MSAPVLALTAAEYGEVTSGGVVHVRDTDGLLVAVHARSVTAGYGYRGPAAALSDGVLEDLSRGGRRLVGGHTGAWSVEVAA